MNLNRVFTPGIPIIFACILLTTHDVQAQVWLENDIVTLAEVDGEFSGDQFGRSVHVLTDLTGDGIPEFIAGAPCNDTSEDFAGRAYVVNPADGSVIFTITGLIFNEFMGGSVSAIGDLNGDGVDDILVGATDPPRTGRVVVVSGASEGEEGTVLHTFFGEQAGGNFGFSVSSAGDFNGDGTDDIVISAVGYQSERGKTYIYSGADFSLICSMVGEFLGDRFGWDVTSAGDINGDFRDDVVVTATQGGSTGTGIGYVYSWNGSECELLWSVEANGFSRNFGRSIASGSDVTNDGISDILISDSQANRTHLISGADGSEIHVFGDNGESGSFGSDCSFIEDSNSDGIPDVMISAVRDSHGAQDGGRVWMYSGSDGSVIRTMTIAQPNWWFGSAIGSMGDIDNDGFPEILASATRFNNFNGRVYVIAGNPSNNVTDVCPSSFDRIRGLGVSGDLDALCDDDSVRLVTRPDVLQPSNIPPIQIEVEGFAPVDNASRIKFEVDSHVSVNNIMQRILLYNFQTKTYDLVDSRLAEVSNDATVEIILEENSNNYVEAGTGRMKSLIQYVQVAFNILPTWQARIDRSAWIVTE